MGCVKSKRFQEIEARNLICKKSLIPVTTSSFLRMNKSLISDTYRILGTIGVGCFAEIKKCFHIPTDQIRAIKRIDKLGLVSGHYASESKDLNEIKSLRQLDHPHILRVYDLFEDDKSFYIVTDLCEGGQLLDKISSISEQEVARVMEQILSAVSYCHSHGIIHRDLKPENILLEDSNSLSVKIADFGSSAFLDRTRRLSGVFGSAFYVAPEVLTGKYNEKCDIWSCGVIMYLLLTGKPPYKGKTEQEIIENVRKSPLNVNDSLSGVSESAWKLLTQLLQVDYRARISASIALTHPWLRQDRYKEEAMISSAASNLMKYKKSVKLKEAVRTFIASQMIDQHDCAQMKNDFMLLDQNGDGVLDKEELLDYFKKSMRLKDAMRMVEEVIKAIDTDNSGTINYSEFVVVCMQQSAKYNSEVLKLAFDKFDVDHSGEITCDEIKEVLQGDNIIDDKVWQDIIAEADKNGDGKVDLQEFLEIMESRF